MVKKNGENILVGTIFLVSLLVISFGFYSNPFSKLSLGHDSSMFYYFGKGMARGLVPYTEMLDHKGPFLFLINFLAVKLNLGVTGLWLVEVFFLTMTLFFSYRTGFLLTKNKIASVLVFPMTMGLFLHVYEGGNLSEGYAVALIANALYLFCKLLLRHKLTNLEYVWLGILGGLTFFLRGNMIALWIVFCFSLVIQEIVEKNYQKLGKQAGLIFLGGFMVVLLMILYCWSAGNLSEMIRQAFVMNIKYSSVTFKERLQMGRFFLDILIRYGFVALLILAEIIMLTDDTSRESKTLYFILSIYFLVNYYTVILSGRPYSHYLITQLPIILLFLAILLAGLMKKVNSPMILVSICVLMLMVPALATKRNIQKELFEVNLGTDAMKQGVDQEIQLANYINSHSTSKDKIYVHNLDANVYLRSNRFANSRFFTLPAVDYTKFNQLRLEFQTALKKSPPKFIVIRRELLQKPLDDKELDRTVMDTIKQNYHPIPQFEQQGKLLYQQN